MRRNFHLRFVRLNFHLRFLQPEGPIPSEMWLVEMHLLQFWSMSFFKTMISFHTTLPCLCFYYLTIVEIQSLTIKDYPVHQLSSEYPTNYARHNMLLRNSPKLTYYFQILLPTTGDTHSSNLHLILIQLSIESSFSLC